MILTKHAKQRLRERYGITKKEDFNNILSIANNKNAYKKIHANQRVIKYRGQKILLVVRNDRIITAVDSYQKYMKKSEGEPSGEK